MIPKQLIIIGGGASIKEGIEKGLWNKLEGKFTIGLNYSYKYFKSTLTSFVDKDFYAKYKSELENLPLIVGKFHKIEKYPNTIMLNAHHEYTRDLSKGVYKSALVGIFALSLGIYLLDEGEIFLLGYDFGELRKSNYTDFATSRQMLDTISHKDEQGRPLTHFYQGEIIHRGIAKTSYYNTKGRGEKDFLPFQNEQKVKIYNVSIPSKLTSFPKITYEQFFNMLDEKKIDQDIMRAEIINKLEGIKDEDR